MSEQRVEQTDGDLLANPRFELMPFDSIEEQASHLPDGSTIAITASPSLGLEDTITWTERLQAEGYEIVPHIAARFVRDEDHLTDVCDRILDAGVTDIFVPGGDPDPPKGKFDSSYQLLTTMEELGYEFDEVGITGYPEGHQFLSEDELYEFLEKKEPHATYIATQICYDPNAIIEWIEDVRARDIHLPIEMGIPGVMKYQRLIGISRKVGVGDSVKFLQKTTGILGFIKQFLGSRGKYSPDDLVDGLEPYTHDDHYNIRGYHIYTFNQVPDTESWRLDRLGE